MKTQAKNLTQKRAKEIMGDNFFGIKEGKKFFKIPNYKEFNTLELEKEIPFSETLLEKVRDTHLLIAVFPLSIIQMREIVSHLFPDQIWYNNEPFAKRCGRMGWQLVCKTETTPKSSSKELTKQQLGGEKNKIPTAQILVYSIIGHYLNTGERLFESSYVYTSSFTESKSPVVVGCFDLRGLKIENVNWVNYFNHRSGISCNIKVASMVKK